MKDTKLLSECCKAPVTTEHGCDSDMGHGGRKCDCADKGAVTMWYECSACHKPCDIYDEDTKIKPDWGKELQEILTNFKDGYYRQYKGVGTEIQIVQNIISNLIRNLLAKQEEQHKMEIIGEAAKLATKDINKLKQQHEERIKDIEKQCTESLLKSEESYDGLIKKLKQQHRKELENLLTHIDSFKVGGTREYILKRLEFIITNLLKQKGK